MHFTLSDTHSRIKKLSLLDIAIPFRFLVFFTFSLFYLCIFLSSVVLPPRLSLPSQWRIIYDLKFKRTFCAWIVKSLCKWTAFDWRWRLSPSFPRFSSLSFLPFPSFLLFAVMRRMKSFFIGLLRLRRIYAQIMSSRKTYSGAAAGRTLSLRHATQPHHLYVGRILYNRVYPVCRVTCSLCTQFKRT